MGQSRIFGLGSASIEKRILALVIGVMAALCAYRGLDYWASGFYVSDEFGYYYEATHGSYYGIRWFFGYLNIALFRFFGINGPSRFATFLPFYLFLWAFLTLVACYKVMKTLKFDERTVALTLFSFLFLISYVLLSLGFLTEPVGLSMAMLGILFLLLFAKVGDGQGIRLLVYPFLSSVFFGAASGTREPYDIFLLGGIALAPIIAMKKRKILAGYRASRKWILLILAVVLFIGPAMLFLQYPYNHLNEIQSRALGIGETVSTPVTVVQVQTQTTRVVLSNVSAIVVMTRTHTITVTSVVNGTTVTSTSYQTQLETSTTVTQTATPINVTGTKYLPILNNHLVNTFVILLGGLALGWGPIPLLFGAIGLLAILRGVLRRKSSTYGIVTILALLALGSYFVVSYIFSTDPNYFSLANFSTIIRFSDTALPAYFLVAPYAFSRVARRRRYGLAVAAALIIFIVVAVPTYETYASSSLVYYTGSNPFAFGYSTDAAQIRNYIASHQSSNGSNVIGWPTGWNFTPGTDTLRNVNVFTPIPGSSIPYLSYGNFTQDRWSSFYVYDPKNIDMTQLDTQAPFVAQFVNPIPPVGGNYPQNPYTVVGREVVLQTSTFSLIRIQLSWS